MSAFQHGVASGDPLPDAIVLWTRVTSGGPLIFASKILVVFVVFGVTSSGAGVFAIPVFVFEASFAIYLIVKGFRPSRVLTGKPATA